MRLYTTTNLKNRQMKARRATHAAILANRKHENEATERDVRFNRRQVTVGLRSDDSLPVAPFPLPPGYRVTESSGNVATVCAGGLYLGLFAVSPRAARQE